MEEEDESSEEDIDENHGLSLNSLGDKTLQKLQKSSDQLIERVRLVS
jgi:hypothetical protein